jgi:hypothetical protein
MKSDLTPDELLKTPAGEPRPRSNWANIVSCSIAALALVCSVAVLCITTENQCIDRRDRRILQQPNVWLDRDPDHGALYLVNSGPGAALIKESKTFYNGKPLPTPTGEEDIQHFINRRTLAGDNEWVLGMTLLSLLRDKAHLCAGGKSEGCLPVDVDLLIPMTNYMMSPGQRLPFLRINSLEEIRKHVTEEDFRTWKNHFGVGFPWEVDFTIEYCPLSHDFGPCRTVRKRSVTEFQDFPDLAACPSGLAALWPTWRTWWR